MQNILKFKQPASCWEEAMPLGNGTLGAMVYGGENTVIKFNHDCLWSGTLNAHPPVNRQKELQELRKLIFERRYDEANEYAYAFVSKSGVGMYMPLGNLCITKIQKANIVYAANEEDTYERSLDFSCALAKERFIPAKEHVMDECRTSFVSYPHNVFVLRIKSEKPTSYCFSTSCPLEHVYFLSDEYIGFKGKAPSYMLSEKPEDGIPISSNGKNTIAFSFAAKPETNGKCIVHNNEITIYNATEITLYVAAETNFDGFGKEPDTSKDTLAFCLERIDKALHDGYEKVETAHINDYKKLYDRVKIELADSYDEYTDIRRKNFISGNDDSGIFELMFNFGRYLLIASSRENSQPANLQGIWSESIVPPWACDYTVNINTEMNYWPAEVCNLPECHIPLFKMLEDVCKSGEKTARTIYGCGGSCAHHNIDLWRNTNIAEGCPLWALWPVSEMWLISHLRQHYEYTLDIDFLKNTAYPIMQKSVEFLKDFLVEDNNGYLVTCPSISPENSFIFNGKDCCVSKMTTMDNSIIREFLDDYEKTCADLGYECDISEIKEKLPPINPASDGRIPEWCEEFEEVEPGHRHVSHLYGLFPGKCLRDNGELTAAAEKSIEERLANGGGGTGWSRAWLINLYAHLKNGEKAYEQAASLIKISTYSSLFDKHPPFQIDGNFGFTSAIAYMLMQSYEEDGVYHIELLPAIPEKWKKGGSVRGLAAKGGFIVGFKWENGNIFDITVENKFSNKYVLEVNNKNMTHE